MNGWACDAVQEIEVLLNTGRKPRVNIDPEYGDSFTMEYTGRTHPKRLLRTLHISISLELNSFTIVHIEVLTGRELNYSCKFEESLPSKRSATGGLTRYRILEAFRVFTYCPEDEFVE